MYKFKVGDRVAVYDKELIGDCQKGIIRYFVYSYITVKLDNGKDIAGIHPRQCRLLKKKAKAPRGKVGGRVIWVSEECLENDQFKDGISTTVWCRKRKSNAINLKFVEAEDQSE